MHLEQSEGVALAVGEEGPAEMGLFGPTDLVAGDSQHRGGGGTTGRDCVEVGVGDLGRELCKTPARGGGRSHRSRCR